MYSANSMPTSSKVTTVIMPLIHTQKMSGFNKVKNTNSHR